MSLSFVRAWQIAFSQAVQVCETAPALQKAAMEALPGEWTRALRAVCIGACEQMGWQASTKGHEMRLLPDTRDEYLTLDIAAFAPESQRWRFPAAAIELENSRRDSRIAYSLWKVLCVRTSLRVVFCYRPLPRQASKLIHSLQFEIVQAMDLQTRLRLDGETLVVIGRRSEAETFPHGFFQWWWLEKNTGVFEAI